MKTSPCATPVLEEIQAFLGERGAFRLDVGVVNSAKGRPETRSQQEQLRDHMALVRQFGSLTGWIWQRGGA